MNVFTPRGVPLHPEDEKIVEYAREICSWLNASRLQPTAVSWVKRLLISQVIIFRGTLMLPERLMEKLTPEEWRPLLASGILYYNRFRSLNSPYLKSLVLPLAVGMFVLIPALFVTLRVSAPYSIWLLLGVLVSWTIFSGYLLWRSLFVESKRARFEADEKAAELFGRDAIIATLTKIDSLNLDYKPLYIGRLNYSPNIRQRLEHLKKADS